MAPSLYCVPYFLFPCSCGTTHPAENQAFTLRLASRHGANQWAERRKWSQRSVARIPSLALRQEGHAVEVLRNNREPRRGIRELECEHRRMVLAGEQSALRGMNCARL